MARSRVAFAQPDNPMIQSVRTYYEDVMARGTPNCKLLLLEEAMFAATEAKAIAAFATAADASMSVIEAEIQDRLIALLVSHRAQVISNFLMERASGRRIQMAGGNDMTTRG